MLAEANRCASVWISLGGLSVHPTSRGISSGSSTLKKLVHFSLNSKLLPWDIASALCHSVLMFLVRINPTTLWFFFKKKKASIRYSSEEVKINGWKTATRESASKYRRK